MKQSKRSFKTLAERVVRFEGDVAVARLKIMGAGGQTTEVRFDKNILETEIADCNWHVRRRKDTYSVTRLIAANNKSGKTTEYLHRAIMQPRPGLVVDHINHDGRDNTRANLRVCTNSQNLMNRSGPAAHSKSNTLGVYKHPTGWVAIIKRLGERYTSGVLPRKKDAIEWRLKMEKQIFGEFQPTFRKIQAT